jgi:hypothetical protein
MKLRWVVIAVLSSTIITYGFQNVGKRLSDECGIFQSPSKCPFVDSSNGLECLGVPMPDGVSVAGQKWRCTNGHTWIERN